MDEKKLWEYLKNSGETLVIPESLLPERIEEKLREYKGYRAEKQRSIRKMAAAAACILLCTVGLAMAAPLLRQGGSGMSAGMDGASEAANETAQPGDISGVESEAFGGSTDADAGSAQPFTAAGSYGEIYDMLKAGGNAGTDAQSGESEHTVTDGTYAYTLKEISLVLPDGDREECISGEGLREWFPEAGGQPVAAEDCWLLWGGGSRAFLLVSANAQELVQAKLILTDGAEAVMDENKVTFTCVQGENAGEIAEIIINEGKISYTFP